MFYGVNVIFPLTFDWSAILNSLIRLVIACYRCTIFRFAWIREEDRARLFRAFSRLIPAVTHGIAFQDFFVFAVDRRHQHTFHNKDGHWSLADTSNVRTIGALCFVSLFFTTSFVRLLCIDRYCVAFRTNHKYPLSRKWVLISAALLLICVYSNFLSGTLDGVLWIHIKLHGWFYYFCYSSLTVEQTSHVLTQAKMDWKFCTACGNENLPISQGGHLSLSSNKRGGVGEGQA